MRTLTPGELQMRFPKLHPDNWQPFSKANPRYNCVAFANGDERHWWEAGQYGKRYYWPLKIRHQNTLESWVELFMADGYEPIASREHEPGFEKVAIFVSLDDMLPSHVAKSDGYFWKSKLGKGQDIRHKSLDILEGDQQDEYGIVECVLGRPARSK